MLVSAPIATSSKKHWKNHFKYQHYQLQAKHLFPQLKEQINVCVEVEIEINSITAKETFEKDLLEIFARKSTTEMTPLTRRL